MNSTPKLNLNRHPISIVQQSLSSFRSFLSDNALLVFPGLIFFAIVLLVNWQLFARPLIEDGDLAANALQVQNAKHLHELLGNYSRWHFHHPGPFFFYLFAAGETVLYDLLHLVPAPLNADCITEIAFSTLCLFLSIYIFYSNVKRPLLPVLAIPASILFLYGVDTALPGSAMSSVWLPHAPLFAFLLLLSSSASVAAGRWKHTPLMAMSGMILIHAHVAQLLFAVVLTAAALLTAVFREFKWGNPTQAFRAYRAYLCGALAIVALFVLPIVIDWIIHDHSNVAMVAAYLSKHHGEHNSFLASFLYVCSFFTYCVTPDVVVSRAHAGLIDVLNPEQFVRLYWTIFLFFAFFSITTHLLTKKKLPPFLRLVFCEVLLVVMLFFYWSWRITGPMFTFNGYFFFSVQLFMLLAFVALLSVPLDVSIGRSAQLALACACPTLLLLVGGIEHVNHFDPAIPAVVSFLKNNHVKSTLLTTSADPAAWPTAAGIARYMQRSGMDFCFGPEWTFMYGREHTCTNNAVTYQVNLSGNNLPLINSMSALRYERPGLYVTGAPIPAFLSMPVVVTANDSTHQSLGFDVIEGDGSWSKKESSLRFYVSAEKNNASSHEMDITGTMLPGRPVEIKLNGRPIGEVGVPWRSTQQFRINDPAVVKQGLNILSLHTSNAGPLGVDDRELGYRFERFVLRDNGSK